MSEEKQPLKAVLYSDGGYQQRYGCGGWGIHGYTYIEQPPTRGTGNPKAVPTAKGYAADKTDVEKVTVTQYVDGVGGVFSANSSNHTELIAASNALKWTLENDVHHATVFSDSKYVVDGITQWMPKWKDRGWKNGQGEDIANKDLWLQVDDLVEQLKNSQRHVRFEWIKGHAGFFGNEVADSYATKGNLLGRRKSDFTFLKTRAPDGYWNRKNDYHKLLGSGRWYFSTIDKDFVREDGSYTYYLGDLLEDDHTGKPVADNANAVVFLKLPDPVLESLRAHAVALDRRQIGTIMLGRLDVIFSPGVYSEIVEHGTSFLNWGNKRLDIMTARDEPIVKEKSPPGLVWLAVDALNHLESKLMDWINGAPYLVRTDILSTFYDEHKVKETVNHKLKKDITSSTKYVEVNMRYSTAKASEIASAEIKSKKVRLLLAIDVPKRNTLAGIGEEISAMELISWRESDQAVRHATVIRTESGVGIWAGVDSNLVIV